MRILVTGATGFTGGHLARTLVNRGHDVCAIAREGADTSGLLRDGIEIITGDLRSGDDVLRAAEDCELIYHIAAVFRTAGHGDEHYHQVNVGGTENVIAAAKKHHVKRLVHCSTMGVHGNVSQVPSNEDSPYNPGDIYQRTKLEGERRVQEAIREGLAASIVRPAGIYGPGDHRFLKLFRAIHRGTFRMFGSGETLYHLVYIDDLVAGILLCGEHPKALGRAFLIGGPRYVTLNELVRTIADALGTKPPRGRLPVWPLLAAGAACEAVFKPLGLEPPLHRRRVHFFIKNRAFDISRARNELGYDPQVDLAKGMHRTAQWYMREGLLPMRSPAEPVEA